MQLYQKRDFGALIGDSFNFFKEYGRNYFKNFLIINGGVIILMIIIGIFWYQELFSQIIGDTTGNQFYFEEYFQKNALVLIGLGVVTFAVLVLLGLTTYSYPLIYMKKVAETGRKDFKTDELVTELKANIPKFLKYFSGLLFIMLPIMMVAVGLSALMMMIVIGFFLLLLVVPTAANIINFTLFEYYNTKNGFFSSLNNAMKIQFSQFWKYFGSTAVMYFIIQVISSMFTTIPMMIIMGGIFATVPNPDAAVGNGEEFSRSMLLMMAIIYPIAFLMSLILQNLMFVNMGLMYYDSRKDLHRNLDLVEIDKIGTVEN